MGLMGDPGAARFNQPAPQSNESLLKDAFNRYLMTGPADYHISSNSNISHKADHVGIAKRAIYGEENSPEYPNKADIEGVLRKELERLASKNRSLSPFVRSLLYYYSTNLGQDALAFLNQIAWDLNNEPFSRRI